MGLRDIESSLPPGFRFYPRDEELVCHYLYNKVCTGERASLQTTMVEVDLHSREPWELPEVAKLTANEWYFFSFRDRKYATGSRANRATRSGYWKATGKDRPVHDASSRAPVGMRKTLVFYCGRAPNGIKSGWVMHEFRLENPHAGPKEDWVLCRVFHKRKEETASNTSGNCPFRNIEPSPPTLADQLIQEYASEQVGSSFTCTSHQEQHNGSSSFFMEIAAMQQCNFLGFPLEVGMSSKSGGDDYDFLLDLSRGDHSMGI